MLLLAGSLAVEKVRSAPVRRAVGAAVRRGRVVVFLPGFGGHVRRDGDGLLLAAGWRVPGRGEDLGPVAVQGHGGGPQRAADLPHDRGAGDAVIAIGVVAGDPAELVAGGLGGLLVVGFGLFRGGVAGQRAELEQCAGCCRAVEVAVGDDGAVMGPAGAAVGRVQVLDQLRPGQAQRHRPGPGVAVGVAGVGQDAAGRDARRGHRGQHRD
jgi:hypothetical protein